MKNTIDQNRRRVMKQLALLAGGSSLLATQSRFSLMGSALAASGNYQGLTDHKSLVCVFLFGGCDALNLTVPYAPERYQVYANVRQGLAIPRAQLLPAAGNTLAFHPNASGLRTLYNEGKLAVVANVGTLFEPLTVAQYDAGKASGKLIPPDLFSHSHQQETWQTAKPAKPSVAQPGWGGLMADLLISANSSQDLPISFSLNGSNLWESGVHTQPFGVRPGQDIATFDAFDHGTWPRWRDARSTAWEEILKLSRTNLLQQHAAFTLSETRRRSDLLRGVLAAAPDIITPYNADNDLANQLRGVAKLISVREAAGMKRQVFFVSLGGWDTHDTQLPTQGALLTKLGEALLSFQRTLEELGVANSVTTFTASDFGRTFTSNKDGTDHAWATDVMVMGGAVKGGMVHGDPIDYTDQPTLTQNGRSLFGPADVGAGRFIPKYSVDQYAATLGKWMGLTDADLVTILPNLSHFSTRTLGFMA